MQSRITPIILSKTASSRPESLGSKTQRDSAPLSSDRHDMRDGSEATTPVTKKVLREESAAEVMGPEDVGELIMAMKGSRISMMGTS